MAYFLLNFQKPNVGDLDKAKDWIRGSDLVFPAKNFCSLFL